MAKRTLKSCWTQYEKLSQTYLNDLDKRPATVDKLNELTFKANGDRIGDALLALFVKPHLPDTTATLEFTCTVDDGIPEWQTQYDAESETVLVHPLSVVALIHSTRETNPSGGGEGDFLRERYLSFLKEMIKLPSIYFLFLLVLQRVAYMLEIAHLEKRGGVVEVAEGEPYHTMLWAFKELEAFCGRTYGVTLRAQYAILWYESDWITGR